MAEPDDEGDDWFAPPTVNTRWHDGVLYVSGEVDLESCGFLRAALAAHTGEHLVCDLSALVFCDSSCLKSFLDIVRSGRRLTLLQPTPQVARVLAIVVGAGIPGLTIES